MQIKTVTDSEPELFSCIFSCSICINYIQMNVATNIVIHVALSFTMANNPSIFVRGRGEEICDSCTLYLITVPLLLWQNTFYENHSLPKFANTIFS